MNDPLADRLAAAGFIAPHDEAEQLRRAAGGDAARLHGLVERRLTGEPLAWITGVVSFAGLELHVDPGVYVPRPHTELIAEAAATRLSQRGLAVDVCTGCGAVAAVLKDRRPEARVVATDSSSAAVACARRNGVDAHVGDLLTPLPPDLRGTVDVLTAVAPYVPTSELGLLQRDTFTFEDADCYSGGEDGLDVLRRLLPAAAAVLRPGGAIVLELGSAQVDQLVSELAPSFGGVQVVVDEDGDERGLAATVSRIGL